MVGRMSATPGRSSRTAHPRAASWIPFALLLVACSAPPDEPVAAGAPVQVSPSGAELWVSQNCALCHGPDGASAWWRPGPDLLPNLHRWTAPALAAYIADPMLAARNMERLDGTGMPGYPHLTVSERLRLARYVLGLGAARDV